MNTRELSFRLPSPRLHGGRRLGWGWGCRIPMQVVEWQTIMDEASDFREGRANRFAKGDSGGVPAVRRGELQADARPGSVGQVRRCAKLGQGAMPGDPG